MLRVSVMCFLASYLLAFGLEWTRFVSRSQLARWLAIALGVAGFLAQTLYLLIRNQQTNLPPLLSSMQDWLLVLAWVLVLVHLFVTISDRELALGFVFWPLVLALIVAAQFASTTAGTAVNVHRNWAMLHVALLVLGMASVAVGLIISLVYLWQHRRMKQGISSADGFDLPSLERLARINRWTVLASAPLLTFGMLIGIGLTLVKAPDQVSHVWTDPVVIVSAICWLLMSGVFMWLVTGKRPPGRQMAWLTLWSCGFLLLTTIGAQILTQAMSASAVHGAQPPAGPLPAAGELRQ